MLTFKKLREANSPRCKQWLNGVTWSLSDWGVAMAGEAGEACDAIKKLNRLRDGMITQENNKQKLTIDLAKEIADTIIYADLLAEAAGIDLEEAIVNKFNEVSDRFGFEQKL